MQVARLVLAFAGILITVTGVRWVFTGLAFMGSGAVNSGGITLPLGLAGAAVGVVVALIGVSTAAGGLTAWIRGERQRPEVGEAGPISGPISRFVLQGGAAVVVVTLLMLQLRGSFDGEPRPGNRETVAGPFTESGVMLVTRAATSGGRPGRRRSGSE